MRWPVQLLLVAVIWGASFMFIKVELDAGLAVVHVAWLRCALGAPALLAIVWLTRDRLPRERGLYLHLLVIAALMNALPFLLFAFGETEVSSLLAGIINALTPLITLLFSIVVLPDEPPTAEKVAGLGVGFAGVLVVLAPWDGLGGGSLLGALACIGAATCYGLGFPYMRRHVSGRPETGGGDLGRAGQPRRAAAAAVPAARRAARTRRRARGVGCRSSRSARSAPASPTSSTSTSCARRARRPPRWSPTSCRCSRSSSA